MNALIRDNGSKTIRQFLSEWKERVLQEKPEWPTFEEFTQAIAEAQSKDTHQLRREICAVTGDKYEDVKHKRVHWTLENVGDFDGGSVVNEFTIQFTPLTQVNNNEPT